MYEVGPEGTLEGRWTHADIGHAVSTERAYDGQSNIIEGRYRVEIFQPDSTVIFRGDLTIARHGTDVFSLIWIGTFVGGREGRFVGIGMQIGNSTLAASFEAVSSPS